GIVVAYLAAQRGECRPDGGDQRQPPEPRVNGQDVCIHAQTLARVAIFTFGDKAGLTVPEEANRDGRPRPVTRTSVAPCGVWRQQRRVRGVFESLLCAGGRPARELRADSRHGRFEYRQARFRRNDVAGRVLSQYGGRRCPAAVAVPDGALGPAAAGEDDALLAQLLR